MDQIIISCSEMIYKIWMIYFVCQTDSVSICFNLIGSGMYAKWRLKIAYKKDTKKEID